MEPQNQLIHSIQPEAPNAPITILVNPRDLQMYFILDSELKNLFTATSKNSLNLAFLGITFGSALSLGITIFTVDIQGAKTIAIFWASFLVALMSLIYFSIRVIFDSRTAKNQIKDIMQIGASRVKVGN